MMGTASGDGQASRPSAWLGLGAMGYPMAGNLTARSEVMVWNRNREVSERHAASFGTTVLDDDFAGLENCGSIFLCVPTSVEVEDLMRKASPRLSPGTVIVDCTSGHPQQTIKIAKWLKEDHDVEFLDCAVSGGPGGARKGTLASFVGGDDAETVKRMVPIIETFSQHIVHLGPVGAGHAVKAINNAMNVSNLLCATEGLLALRKLGIDPTRACAVINKSSGRSLMSEVRVPQVKP